MTLHIVLLIAIILSATDKNTWTELINNRGEKCQDQTMVVLPLITHHDNDLKRLQWFHLLVSFD